MTIGPAPMIRIDLMSVRLGMPSRLPPFAFRLAGMLFHQPHELVEQIIHVVRTGACLGVTLETERGAVGALEALERAVEQRDVSDARRRRQGCRVHGEAMVLAR